MCVVCTCHIYLSKALYPLFASSNLKCLLPTECHLLFTTWACTSTAYCSRLLGTYCLLNATCFLIHEPVLLLPTAVACFVPATFCPPLLAAAAVFLASFCQRCQIYSCQLNTCMLLSAYCLFCASSFLATTPPPLPQLRSNVYFYKPGRADHTNDLY